jgi:hypothetical protein
MTTKPKTRKAAAKARKPRIITEKEAAAMDFEPWQGEINLKALPTNDQFINDSIPHLQMCRLALASMYMTKAKMMDLFEKDGDAQCNLIEYLGAADAFFSQFADRLKAAICRHIAAGSSVLQGAKTGQEAA